MTRRSETLLFPLNKVYAPFQPFKSGRNDAVQADMACGTAARRAATIVFVVIAGRRGGRGACRGSAR